MTSRELLHYYSIYEYQATEEEIRNEFLYPKEGKPKTVPKPERMAELVKERILKQNKK